VGKIAKEVGALFYVDFVSSAGGVPISVQNDQIDIGLLGSQKVFSIPPDLAMLTVSKKAWIKIKEIGYKGYDALAPWPNVVADRILPYTHNWHSVAALHVALSDLLNEGLSNVYQRHETVAQLCRKRLKEMGIELFPVAEEANSPTVTAAKVPLNWGWKALDKALRDRGVVFGGSYGPLAEKVFRVGHMGTQANEKLVTEALNILQEILNK